MANKPEDETIRELTKDIDQLAIDIAPEKKSDSEKSLEKVNELDSEHKYSKEQIKELSEVRLDIKKGRDKEKSGSRIDNDGNELDKEDWTDACHRVPAQLATQIIDKSIGKGNMTIVRANKIKDFVNGEGNLRICKKSVNVSEKGSKVGHTHYEKEIQKSINDPTHHVSYKTMLRVKIMIKAVNESKMTKQDKLSFASALSKVTQKQKDGSITDVKSSYNEDTDMRKKGTKNHILYKNTKKLTKTPTTITKTVVKTTTTTTSTSSSSSTSKPSITLNNDGSISGKCQAVRSGDLKFTASGQVDKRCAAVRSNNVKLTKAGNVDKRTVSRTSSSKPAPKKTTCKPASRTTSRSSYSGGGGGGGGGYSSGGSTYVSGYTRSNGTVVSGYSRSSSRK